MAGAGPALLVQRARAAREKGRHARVRRLASVHVGCTKRPREGRVDREACSDKAKGMRQHVRQAESVGREKNERVGCAGLPG